MSSGQKRPESVEADEENGLPLLEISEKHNVSKPEISKLKGLKLLISSVKMPPISSLSPSTPLHLKMPTFGNNTTFILWTVINTLATIGIVFTNKAIFSDPRLRLNQSSFAAFHFVITGLTLFCLGRPPFSMFEPRRIRLKEITPLSTAMCLNVILPNLSLAYSTVAFYQIVRVLLTPTVAAINFVLHGTRVPREACYAIVPVCLGVAIVTYFDTRASASGVETTSAAGVFFSCTGIVASSLYTVWIGVYRNKLEVNSMQLLVNSAPTSAVLLLYAIPMTDVSPDWTQVAGSRYGLIILSGLLASMINISQFFIVAGAGPVSSTVVGHLKTCAIVALGWIVNGRGATDKGVLGVVMALGGIVTYSVIMYKHKQRSGLKA